MLLNEETNDNPLKKLSVLELGTGSGLVSIACSMDPREQYGPIIATDYEPVALELARYAYERLNGYREGARNLSFGKNNIFLPKPSESVFIFCDC